MKEEGRQSGAAIPAQSYEEDILPRYREALSLGLNSYRNHVQSRTSLGSVFRNGSRRGPLPHIIGSDEYIHDNSCGLVTEDSTSSESSLLDVSHAGERNDVHSSAAGGSHGTFAADLLAMEHIPKKKDQVEPMVSAASDFKAMLEAALLSSYKFYDEDSTTPSDFGSHNTTNLPAHLDHTTSTESIDVTDARLASLTRTDECHFEVGEDYPPSHSNHPVYDSPLVSSAHDPEKIIADTEPSGSMSLRHDEVILTCDKQISYGAQDSHSSSMGSSQTDQVTLPDGGSSSKTDN